MDSPAAFRATYSDIKTVKTRGVVQFVFEVPAEEADHAMAVLGGLPKSASQTWVGIARIEAGHVAASAIAPKELVDPGQPLGQAVYRQCLSGSFQRFLGVNSAEEAAEKVRLHCGVQSRSEITDQNKAGQKWAELMAEYQKRNATAWPREFPPVEAYEGAA